MTWKEQIAQLEHEGNFDIAIFLLKKVIKENPDDVDAYIFLLFRLIDTLIEGTCYWANSKDSLRDIKKEYYEAKYDSYVAIAQKYFAESYKKFSDNPKYLFYVGMSAVPDQYIFNKAKDFNYMDMIHKALKLGYNTVLKDEFQSFDAYLKNYNHANEIARARKIINDPSIKEQLATMGAAGQYVVGRDVHEAKKILEEAEKQEDDV